MKVLTICLIGIMFLAIQAGKHYRCVKTPDDYFLHIDNAKNGDSKNPIKQIPGFFTKKAWQFTGKNYMKFDPTNIGNYWTIVFWVRFDKYKSSQRWQRIFDFCNGPNVDQINGYQVNDSNSIGFGFASFQGGYVGSQIQGDILLGEWNHYAYTTTGKGQTTLYRNGKQVETYKKNIVTMKNRKLMYIGKSPYNHDPNLQGALEDFRVYKRVLNIQEIQCLADQCSSSCVAQCSKKSNQCAAKPSEMTDGNPQTCPVPSDVFMKMSQSNNKGTTSIVGPVTKEASYFNGNSYRQFPASIMGGAMTFTMWFRVDSKVNWQRFIDFGISQQKYNILIANPNTSSRVQTNIYWDKWNNAYQSQKDFTLKQWNHLAVVIDDNSNVKMYINGKLDSKQINKQNSYGFQHIARTRNYIGKSNWKNDKLFNGAIDDLKIFKRPLVIEEIQCLAKKCTGRCTNGEKWCAASSKFCDTRKCAQIYSECNYQGDKELVCGKEPYLMMTQIKSIKIDSGYSLTVFNDANYDSQKALFTSSQACLKSIDWK